MLATTVLAASALIAGAFAAPLHVEQLAMPTGLESVSDVDPAIMDYLQHQNFEKNGNHLYFYYLNNGTARFPSTCKNGMCRCGEIDAAQRMPAALFNPLAIRSLANYASLTIKYYGSLGMDRQLALGRCQDKASFTNSHGLTTNYKCFGGGVQGINWTTGSLLNGICQKQCGCGEAQSCKDVPDQPFKGKWCSLCGPKYNGYITIQLYNLPNSAYDDDDSNDDCK